jgi:hypothetical protein
MSAASDRVTLELSIANPMQLFNSMDPAPFRERDLDAEVVAYIVEWAQGQGSKTPLCLSVTLQQAPTGSDELGVLRDAVHESFRRRAIADRRKLKKLFRDGRISLLIGMSFLAAAIFISDYLGGLISNENYAWLLQESVVIGGWVALWHPLNIFLYDWWPIRAEARLFDKLANMEVQLRYVKESGILSSSGSGVPV